MLRKLYDWILRLAAGPYAMPALAIIAFAEASFFPMPPDIMLAPMVYARPQKAWRLALVCTSASVLGGMAGYGIGVLLQPLAISILTFFGHPNALAEFQTKFFHDWGFLIILGKGLTPIPFKLVTIASGLARYNFALFVLACVITRGGRFFIEAALFKKFGPAIQPVIEKRLTLVFVLVVAVVVLGVLAAALVH